MLDAVEGSHYSVICHVFSQSVPWLYNSVRRSIAGHWLLPLAPFLPNPPLLISPHYYCLSTHTRMRTQTHTHTCKREAAHHGRPTQLQLLAPAAPTLPALLPDCIVNFFLLLMFLELLDSPRLSLHLLDLIVSASVCMCSCVCVSVTPTEVLTAFSSRRQSICSFLDEPAGESDQLVSFPTQLQTKTARAAVYS